MAGKSTKKPALAPAMASGKARIAQRKSVIKDGMGRTVKNGVLTKWEQTRANGGCRTVTRALWLT